MIKDALKRMRETAKRFRAEAVHKSWLTRRISVEEAEARHTVDIASQSDTTEAAQTRRAALLEFARSRGVDLSRGPVAFGLANLEWREMVASMQPEDEVWEFNSPEHFWRNTAGRAGVAFVRNGEIIEAFVTAMN
jgi:hypothetical protein